MAANQSKDATEIEKRRQMLVNKIWNAFFKRKMAKEMAKYRHIEDSFNMIRRRTNINDVRTIVEKFMTKETTYS